MTRNTTEKSINSYNTLIDHQLCCRIPNNKSMVT